MFRRLLLAGALAGIAFASSPQDASACILNMPCQSFDFREWVSNNPETVQQFQQQFQHWLGDLDLTALSQRHCDRYPSSRYCDVRPDTPPTTSVPEPGTLSLLAAGSLGLAFVRVRRRDEDE